MDFTLQGSPTPRTGYRQLAGNGAVSRPSSGKPQSRRNPITGEEIEYEPPMSARISSRDESRPQSRPSNVPSLNLQYLKESDKAPGMPLELYNSLNTYTQRTDSSSRSGRDQLHSSRLSSTDRRSIRPADVPSLSMVGDGDQIRSARPTPRQLKPSAWDQAPVPDNLSARPSDKHKELYKQYEKEMKQSYKQYTEAQHGNITVTEDEVNRAVEAVKKNYTKNSSPDWESDEEDGLGDDERLQLSYTSFSGIKDTKKMDATELEDFKRKQKLIETVMIDQLSRAVISAPEQDVRPVPLSHRPGMARGTNRSLHDSKVSTNTTATENLLQKRVRFGARLLTRNGHDAIRELTGFFFHVDNSLTIYEFKQFGKSAKALPFIARGSYCHVRGRRLQEPYSLTDIFAGGNLEFKTSGMHSLPDSVTTQNVAIFRVTEVDDEEKSAILLAGVPKSERERAYARLHMPKSKGELEDRVLLLEIQTYVRKLLKKRGVKTIMGLGHHCRKLDRSEEGVLARFELEKALVQFHIDLGEGVLGSLLSILDEDGTGYIDYSDFLRAVVGEMNEYRKSFVLKAFRKIDASKKGVVSLSDLKKFYNAAKHPKVKSGHCSEMTILNSFLDSFQYCEKTETVSFSVFEEYYEGLSVGVENDEDFVNILKNSWSL